MRGVLGNSGVDFLHGHHFACHRKTLGNFSESKMEVAYLSPAPSGVGLFCVLIG